MNFAVSGRSSRSSTRIDRTPTLACGRWRSSRQWHRHSHPRAASSRFDPCAPVWRDRQWLSGDSCRTLSIRRCCVIHELSASEERHHASNTHVSSNLARANFTNGDISSIQSESLRMVNGSEMYPRFERSTDMPAHEDRMVR